MLDLGKGQIVLVLVSMDLRAGYYRLAEIARQALNIDVERGNTWVVYVSKEETLPKSFTVIQKAML